jgi:hypothetical protein
MNDDGVALRAAWVSEPPVSEDTLRTAVDQVLDKDRSARLRERRLRMAGVVALVFLVPVLIWAAAYGVGPLVRGAYALMAVGCAAGLAAESLYLDWSRRALPGADDTRSQLQKTVFMLECQVWLMRTTPFWASPVFIGVGLIGVWLYYERTLAAAVTVSALDLLAWIASGVGAWRAAAGLSGRRRQIEEVLADLR